MLIAMWIVVGGFIPLFRSQRHPVHFHAPTLTHTYTGYRENSQKHPHRGVFFFIIHITQKEPNYFCDVIIIQWRGQECSSLDAIHATWIDTIFILIFQQHWLSWWLKCFHFTYRNRRKMRIKNDGIKDTQWLSSFELCNLLFYIENDSGAKMKLLRYAPVDNNNSFGTHSRTQKREEKKHITDAQIACYR